LAILACKNDWDFNLNRRGVKVLEVQSSKFKVKERGRA